MHGLSKRAIAGRIPNREPDPLLIQPRQLEMKMLAAELRQIRAGRNLPVCLFAVTPDDLNELERKCPFHISVNVDVIAAGANRGIWNQDFPGRNKELPSAKRVIQVAPIR